MSLVPIILSGGRGTRLWPVSRDLHPKPFIRLDDGQSLLQKALLRAEALPEVQEVLTVTNRELYFKTADEYRQVTQPNTTLGYLLEPEGRNTAPAIAAAALVVAERHGPDALLLVLTADHLITDQDAFAAAVNQARRLASGGRIVTFGIQPNAPETGFGYIEAEGHDVLRFVEKPDAATAQAYLDSGRYVWNAGMFCLSAGTALAAFEQHVPDLLNAVRNTLATAERSAGQGNYQIQLDAEHFSQAPDISFDYAIMEPTRLASVVSCDIGWSDIGSWQALSQLTPADTDGNRVLGDARLHNAHDCYVRSSDRLVSLVGTHDLVVIDTPDALLVADVNQVQDVKHIAEALRREGNELHRLHRTVHRPWGTYTTLEEGESFKIKRIVVDPGHSLSLQMHHHRSEHWVVVSGMAEITNGERDLLLGPNQSTYIPAGCQHRLANPGKLPLVLIEVQSGEYLGEDDIVRFQDVYGRS